MTAGERDAYGPAEPRHAHDHAYGMLLGALLAIFCSDWHWGLIGAFIFVSSLLIAFAHEVHFGGRRRGEPKATGDWDG